MYTNIAPTFIVPDVQNVLFLYFSSKFIHFQDCIHHSSLPFLRTLGVEPKTMQIEVTIGVQQPDKVDKVAVAASLPHGQVTVKVVKGGLDVPDEERGGVSVIAMAGVAVRLDLEAHLGLA